MRFKREHFNLYLNYLNTVSLDKIDKMIEIVENKLISLGAQSEPKFMRLIEKRVSKFESYSQFQILNHSYSKTKWHLENASKKRI